jgi:outer membrane phospholipase A
MYTAKKRKIIKKKSPAIVINSYSSSTNTTNKASEVQLLQKRRLQKETMHKNIARHNQLRSDLRFHPERNDLTTYMIPWYHSQNLNLQVSKNLETNLWVFTRWVLTSPKISRTKFEIH